MFRFFTFMIFLLGFGHLSIAQGIPFENGTWAEVVEKAKAEKKLIFVDAYASWCGPCKKMDQLTFTHQAVTKYFGTHFISFKIDMEKGEGPQLNSLFKVNAYPTLLFISPDQEIVHKITGFQEANKLMAEADKALEKFNPTKEMAILYENGNREEGFVFEYIRTLSEAGKPTKEIAQSYFKGKKMENLSDTEVRILYFGVQESDSKYFEALKPLLPKLQKEFGDEKVEEKINKVCMATVMKAFEFQYEDLVEDAKTHYHSLYPKKSGLFAKRADLNYALLNKDEEKVVHFTNALAEDEYKKEPEKLRKLNETISNVFGANSVAMSDLRISLLDKAISVEPNAESYIEIAQVYFVKGDKETAIQKLEKAVELSLEGDMNRSKAEKMIQSIKSI